MRVKFRMEQLVHQKIFIQSIRARMEALGMSNRRLALLANVSRPHLIEFLANRKQFSSDALARIFVVLNIGMKRTSRYSDSRLREYLKLELGSIDPADLSAVVRKKELEVIRQQLRTSPLRGEASRRTRRSQSQPRGAARA